MTVHRRACLCLIAGWIALPLLAVRGQGVLAPPGSPAPTMKRLDEIEPRTLVSTANTPGVSGSSAFRITQPGSYYLVANISVSIGYGIDIFADNVTLDLNGFTISSTASPATGFGVALDGTRTNVTVLNGSINGTTTNSGATYSGGGFATGIGTTSGVSNNARVSGISVSGVGGNGINLPGGTVQGSSVNVAAGQGIVASTVSNSVANATGSTAINAAAVSNVAGTTTGAGPAIIPTPDSSAIQQTQSALAALQTSVAAIEPRIPIPGGTSTYTISQPGSYYLTGNISVTTGDAIFVGSDNVSLDLNGFTLSSTSAVPSGHGIYLSGTGSRSMVSISNGHIRSGCTVSGTLISNGPGFISGIDYSNGPQNVRVSGVSVTGVKSWGIDLGFDPASTVQACVVRVSGVIGIHAGAVADSSATQCLGSAISAVSVSNCVGSLLTGGSGVTSTATAATDSRTPISTGPFTISAPGSYYLSADLAVGPTDSAVTIAASNVTLDLNGHSIVSTSGTSGGNNAGVSVSGTRQNIRILNGNILGATTLSGTTFTNGGFAYGVFANPAENIVVEGVNVSQIVSGGIIVTGGGIVRSCTVQISDGVGIAATGVHGCAVTSCTIAAISADVIEDCSAECFTTTAQPSIQGITVSNCKGVALGNGPGISGLSVVNCFASAQTGDGIDATTVSNSTGQSVRADGISCSAAANCSGSTGTLAGTHGINARAIASYCVCSTGGGSAIALTTPIAVGCSVSGTVSITNKYLMP